MKTKDGQHTVTNVDFTILEHYVILKGLCLFNK